MITQEECAMLRDVANSVRGVDKAAMIISVDCVNDVRVVIAGSEGEVREMLRRFEGMDRKHTYQFERGGAR